MGERGAVRPVGARGEGAWSTAEDVAARLRPRWLSGALLTAYAEGLPFEMLDLPLRGPRARELGEDLAAARSWASALERAAPGRFDLVRRPVGARTIGASELPVRAVVSSYDQAWRLLGVEDDVARWEALCARVSVDAAVRAWVLAHPHASFEVDEAAWPPLLAAVEWLRGARGSGRRLREITAPGVDTKLVERHRGLIAGVLGVPGSPEGFVEALGLATKPVRMRLRLGADVVPGLALRDVTAPVQDLAALPALLSSAVVVENETTFLSAPVPGDGVVIFGEGFRVSRAGRLPWLADVPVHYWGDLDTHGFAILDQLRAWLPQTRSFLMDRDTLLEHRDRWVAEPTPTSAALTRLTGVEASVYEDLVTDRYADRVRLEQERVDWDWALERWPVER
jgi:hypothetical protein